MSDVHVFDVFDGEKWIRQYARSDDVTGDADEPFFVLRNKTGETLYSGFHCNLDLMKKAVRQDCGNDCAVIQVSRRQVCDHCGHPK